VDVGKKIFCGVAQAERQRRPWGEKEGRKQQEDRESFQEERVFGDGRKTNFARGGRPLKTGTHPMTGQKTPGLGGRSGDLGVKRSITTRGRKRKKRGKGVNVGVSAFGMEG